MVDTGGDKINQIKISGGAGNCFDSQAVQNSDSCNKFKMLSSGWIGLIFGAIIGGCLPLVFGLVLALLGFGCAGISATAVCCGGPSIAAGIMSATGNIASGSVFACKYNSEFIFGRSPRYIVTTCRVD